MATVHIKNDAVIGARAEQWTVYCILSEFGPTLRCSTGQTIWPIS